MAKSSARFNFTAAIKSHFKIKKVNLNSHCLIKENILLMCHRKDKTANQQRLIPLGSSSELLSHTKINIESPIPPILKMRSNRL